MPTYEFYLAKDIVNQAKHGQPLSLASELDWAEALAWVDRRRANRREVKRYASPP